MALNKDIPNFFEGEGHGGWWKFPNPCFYFGRKELLMNLRCFIKRFISNSSFYTSLEQKGACVV